jgi:hypothetical protein
MRQSIHPGVDPRFSRGELTAWSGRMIEMNTHAGIIKQNMAAVLIMEALFLRCNNDPLSPFLLIREHRDTALWLQHPQNNT